ncbi:Ig-like domain-containing protein [Atlantibacter hermannii]|uniref:Ig-like domain-containing protein n=1 Tax=Atlantibacter hermannii TaxID=565 RepID=UPI00289EB3C9|nr:Ig-like domain-containing protein [Atlantibacter hermannii]
MALVNTPSGSVDILNRNTGDLVTQFSGAGNRVINITQSSVVRINASPETVNFYERQGDDLIVHMRDGSTVRYQKFFQLDTEGLHSELIFEDQYGTHHAVFPFSSETGPAAAEAIVPVMADTSLGALIGAEGLSTAAILGGLAAVGGIAGVAVAAGSSGGGGGGSNSNGGDGNNGGGSDGSNGGSDGGNNGGGDGNGNGGGDGNGNGGTLPPGGGNPGLPVSTLVITPFTGDNILNLTESATDQLLSGVTEASNAGRVMTVTLGNNTFTTTVAGDGTWSVTLPAAVLQTLPQGQVALNVSFVDSGGNTVTQDVTLTVDTLPPDLRLAAFSPGNVLDQALVDSGKTISGFTSPEDAGQTVIVTLGENRFEAVIGLDGSWSTLIPSEVLQTLEQNETYTLDISVTDVAGNTATAQQSFIVNTDQPMLQLYSFAGDDELNVAELALDQMLTGWTANIEPGQLVTISLASNRYFASVAGDGSFQVLVPAGDLQALIPDGGEAVATYQSNDGNSLTITRPITVNLAQGDIAIAILSTDDYLSAAESTQPLEVRGVVITTVPDIVVTVSFNGKEYAALVDGAGNWSAVIPPEDLASLPDGVTPVTATVTNVVSSASDTRDLNVIINFLPKPTINTLFGDGFLNAQEVTENQTLSGTTGVTGTGQRVTVQFGDKSYNAIVDVDGRWSVEVPAADLQSLRDGNVPVNVNVIDAAGNTANITDNAVVDITPPSLSLLPFSGDGKVTVDELSAAQTVSGVTTPDQNGREVVVEINNQRFTTTVNSDGTWRIELPAGSLATLPSGEQSYTVTLTDSAGNSQQASGTVSVKSAQPLLSVDTFTGDNTLNAAEARTDQWLTGTTTNVEPGSKIVLVLANQEYSTLVDADGTWRIQLTAADLQKLAEGTNTLLVSVTDAYGQSTSQPYSFTVDKSVSAVAISIIADDDYLNQQESTEDLVVRGTSTGLPTGTAIEVNFGGTVYNATVEADGTWSVIIDAQALGELPDGELTITATATAPDNTTVNDSHLLNVVIASLPVPTLNEPFADGVLNLAERSQAQVITGTTGVTGAGQQVTVTLGGISYRGQVDADGAWSVTLPAGALTGLTEASSPVPLAITVTDAAGNAATLSESFTVDVTPPTISVLAFTGDDILNLAEAGAPQFLRGEATGAEGGQPITVVINGITYQTTTSPQGTWELPVPAADLQALPNGPVAISITAVDSAGNPATVTRVITVDTDPQQQPQLVIDPVTANNIIDAGERLGDVILTGYTLNVEAGRNVTITLDNQTYTGVVDASGRWTVTLPQVAVGALNDGEHTLTVSVEDASGNATSQQRTFTVNLDTSAIALDPITGDNIIGVADLAEDITISGRSVNFDTGATLTVTLNGKQYSATVAADGTWSAQIPQADAAALADGTATLTVSGIDADGNPLSTPYSFNVLTHQTPEPVLNTPFTDGIVSGSELAGGTLSGTTGVTGAGQTVTVLLGGATLNAVVDASGNWRVDVPGTALENLTQGPNPLQITATDAAGNSSTLETNLEVDTVAPDLTINPIAQDDIINIFEATQEIVISGTAGPFDPDRPQYVIVDLNGQQYSALIQEGNIWSVTIPANALSNLPDGPVTVTVTASDPVGNSSTDTTTLTLNTDPLTAPTVTLNPASTSEDIELLLTAPVATLPDTLFTDGFLNQEEAGVGQTLTGNTGLTGSGQVVQVVIDGLPPITGSVDDQGNWTVQLPADVLQNLEDGPHSLTISVVDKAGNASTSESENFNVRIDTLPVPTLTPPFTDGTLNSIEAQAGGTLEGSTGLTFDDVGQVTVSINDGPALQATINPDGSWSLPITAERLLLLPDGTLPVTVVVTDVAGNTSTGNGSFGVVINTLPSATFMTPFGDGVLNYAESETSQTLRGTTGVTGAGQTVILTFNGQDYAGTVNDLGEWSVTLPDTAFAGLTSGTSPTMTVLVTDAAQNTASAEISYEVQTTLPTPQVTELFGNDGYLNAAEAAGPLTLSGTTGVTGANQYVTVTLDVNGTRYVASVDPQGDWSVPLPAGALQSLQNGPHSLTVIAEDQYGNQTQLQVPFNAALTPPGVTINTPVFTDGYLNLAEADGNTQLSGSLSSSVTQGTTVTVTIGGVAFTADVSGNAWTLNLDADSWADVPNGPQSIVVTVTDGALNTGSATVPVTVALAPPTITVENPFDDGALSFQESQQLQTLSGTTTNVEAGQTVTVTLGNQQYLATVQSNGAWSLQLTPQQMALLTPGEITLTATVSDRAQNPATSPALTVAINNEPPEYSVTINPPGTDGYLNASELSGGTVTLSGRTTGFAAGEEVAVTVNGVAVGNAVIDENGDWTLAVPSEVFATQTDYAVIGTTVAEPVTTGTTSVIVDTTPPVVTIAPVTDDDIISAGESNQPLTITGTAGAEEAGRTVTVTVGGQTFYSAVDSAGNWAVTLTPAQVAALPAGELAVTASLTDVAGNPGTDVRPITVDRDAPLLVVDALGVPALLTTATVLPAVLLSGRGDAGETVTVRVGPLIAEAIVSEDGTWTINSADLDLTTLTDGAQVISVTSTDAAGNTSTNNVALNVALNRGLGILVEDLIGGDGVLNVAESLLTQTLTGQIEGDYRGATVEATLLGTGITLPVVSAGPDGRFAIDFPPDIWRQILTNTVSLQLNVTDANGNTTNEIIDVRLALSDLPVIGDVVAAGDNIINVLDSTTSQLVTGTLSTAENVAGVTVTLAGNTFQAVVSGTQWTATIPQSVLAALPDGIAALHVAVTDDFGNVISRTTDLTVALRNLPTLALDPLFGDGTLSIPDLLSGLVSGTATGLAGQTLNISIGSAPVFTTTVGADGRWSVALPVDVRESLQTVGSGVVPVSITAADQNGNIASLGNTLRLDLLQPVLNTLSLFGDGLLNATDALATQTITGLVGNAPAGSSVLVDINGRSFAGVVTTNGTFTINVGPAQLALLADGVFTPTVTITTPNGNTSQVPGNSPVTIGLANLPTVVVNTLFGDGFLNALEAGVAQTISGTVSPLASGTVRVQIGTAAPLDATITNGVWSVQVQPDVLRALPDGVLNVTATVQDAVGNVAVGNKVVNAIINMLPTLTVNTPFGDGTLSLTDLLSNQILSGRATHLAAGTEVTVNLGPLSLKTSVAADGSWQLSLPGSLLQGLADGTQAVSVSATDAAGNVATGGGSLLVAIAALPSIILDPLFGDGGLNATDILSAKVITGSSTNAVGSVVNVALGGKTYQTTVGADGKWSVPVSQTDLGQLLDGSLTVNASLTNPAGNSASTSGLLNVVTHLLPTVSLTSLFGNDNYLNVSEASSGQILSGRITGASQGATVQVTLGSSTPYNATVNPDGTWSLALSNTLLNGLSNGALKVGVAVTDSVGNVNRTSTDVTVKLTTPELTFNALQSLNLLTLLSRGLTLSGGSRNLGSGAVVHLSLLNNTVNTTAITDANGNWSAKLGLGLNILQLLSLSSVLTIYSTDVAGNTGYLNVGLGGNIISTQPPAGFSVTQADAETFSLLAASSEPQETATQQAQTATALKDDAAVSPAPQAATESELNSFTIGGVSIDLADGTYQSGETLQGSDGNDTIHLSTLGFASIDAGAGTDTLMLDGINMTLDLTALTGNLHNIEIFDLGQSGTNAITLDLNEALTITDKPEDDLLIKGSNGDQVNLVKGQGDIWQVSGQREVDGVQFDVYHNSSQTHTLGDVLVQHGLHVNVV